MSRTSLNNQKRVIIVSSILIFAISVLHLIRCVVAVECDKINNGLVCVPMPTPSTVIPLTPNLLIPVVKPLMHLETQAHSSYTMPFQQRNWLWKCHFAFLKHFVVLFVPTTLFNQPAAWKTRAPLLPCQPSALKACAFIHLVQWAFKIGHIWHQMRDHRQIQDSVFFFFGCFFLFCRY